MSNMLPIWLLPFWTLGVPLAWAIVELVRLPKSGHAHIDQWLQARSSR